MLEEAMNSLKAEFTSSLYAGKIFLVDDNARDQDSYSTIFRQLGYQVFTCGSYADAAREIGYGKFDFVVVSQGGPLFQGRCVLERAAQLDRRTPVLVLADWADMQVYLEAMELGAVDYLEKSSKLSEILHIIEENLRHSKEPPNEFREEPKMAKTLSKAAAIAMFLVLDLIILGATLHAESIPAPGGGRTIVNLQAAYHSESNAFARHLAFADKADIEGYHQVAVLFRAVALSEHVHLSNHAALIRKMGAQPEGEVASPIVKSTWENLGTSINHVAAVEGDLIYPAFIRDANSESNNDAARTFEYARNTKAQHARLFITALVRLDQMTTVSHTYHVCMICGAITDKPQPGRCKTCANASAHAREGS